MLVDQMSNQGTPQSTKSDPDRMLARTTQHRADSKPTEFPQKASTEIVLRATVSVRTFSLHRSNLSC